MNKLKQLLLPLLVVLAVCGVIAGTASAATATWSGHTVSTAGPTVGLAHYAKAWRDHVDGNISIRYRVLKNLNGNVTYMPFLPAISTSWGSGPPGLSGSTSWGGEACNPNAFYVSQVKVNYDPNGGGSAWVSGPGLKLC